MGTWEVVIRAVTSFLVLFILTRMMGRKEISQMTFFNFVSAISIGSIAANLVANPSFKLLHGILALSIWSIITILMDLIDLNSKKARMIVSGDPVMVIREGKIMGDALRKRRLDLNSLKAMLRQQGIFSLSDVDFAVFENNGNLSVLKKEVKQNATKGDFGIKAPSKKVVPLATEVIIDGSIVTQNLEKSNLEVEWLDEQLKNAGIHTLNDVLYAEVQTDGSLYIDHKAD